MIDCRPCRILAQADRPPREWILDERGWRAAHAFGTSLPGWLVLLPRRHVTRLSELAADEAAALGPLLSRLSSALEAELGCEKTYVALFAEAEGFAHVHFHLVPRMPEFSADDVGPRVFGRFFGPDVEELTEAERDALALRLRARLAT